MAECEEGQFQCSVTMAGASTSTGSVTTTMIAAMAVTRGNTVATDGSDDASVGQV